MTRVRTVFHRLVVLFLGLATSRTLFDGVLRVALVLLVTYLARLRSAACSWCVRPARPAPGGQHVE
jgi:hypothetical protein